MDHLLFDQLNTINHELCTLFLIDIFELRTMYNLDKIDRILPPVFKFLI